jgi:putative membrane protein
MPYYGMMGGGWGFFGSVLMFLFWVIVIILVILLIKHLIEHEKLHNTTTKQPLVENKSPLDIAKERYAKGEITKDELEEIKNNLI